MNRRGTVALIALTALMLGACSGSGSDGSPLTTSATDGTPPTSDVDTPITSWSRTDPPRIEGSTDEVVIGASGLADGTYWAVLDDAAGGTVATFTVMRAHFGDACMAYAASTRGVECMSGYAVQRTPSAQIALAASSTVTVAAVDDPEASYTVTPSILSQLSAEETVSTPAGYTWAAFPFVLTVEDGQVTAARQFWIP